MFAAKKDFYFKIIGVVCCLSWFGLQSCSESSKNASSDVASLQASQDKDDQATQHQPLTPITLRINCWTGYVEPIKEAFIESMKEKGFDVTLEVSSTNGLDTFLDVLREDKADLISPANDLYTTFVNEKLIRPIEPKNLSHYSQLNQVLLDKLGQDVLKYGAPYTFGPYALAYRKEAFPEAPNSYSVLWDAAHSGKVSISEYDTANIYMAALLVGVEADNLFDLTDAQLSSVTEKLKQLNSEQKPIYWSDNLDPELADSLNVATDWGVGVRQINAKSMMAGEKNTDSGANKEDKWGLLIPQEGATAWVDLWMMSARLSGDRLKVAYEFIDFSLSAESQAQIARKTSYGVTNVYVGRHMSAAEMVEHHLTDTNYFSDLVLWKPLDEEVLKRYQAAWKQAMMTPQ